jgi:hypothetical protein
MEYKYAPARIVQLADKLIELKKNKGPWEVIKFIVEGWSSTNPTAYKSFIQDVEINKQTRKVTNVGNKQFSGVSKTSHGMLRYKLDIPVTVINMIRKLYSPQELPMNARFYDKLARMFPKFIISERV